MKNNQEYKRCTICDHVNFDDASERRDFVHDNSTQEYHCVECAKAIQGAILDQEELTPWASGPSEPYWKRRPFRKGNRGRPKDTVLPLPDFEDAVPEPNLELLDPIDEALEEDIE